MDFAYFPLCIEWARLPDNLHWGASFLVCIAKLDQPKINNTDIALTSGYP